MANSSDSLLGKHQGVPQTYCPEILYPIARAESRRQLASNECESGFDIWHAWEVSCLNQVGQPMQFIARLVVPASSPNLIESKSLKLYLNSLNNHRVTNVADFEKLLIDDLSHCAQSTVEVQLFSLKRADILLNSVELAGICLDDIELREPDFTLNKQLLDYSDEIVEEQLYSRVFRSNCPVTAQPDWATVIIRYKGKKMIHKRLLEYLVSYRNNQEFHEQCVERIFSDILQAMQPEKLLVQACFLRRGGLDITPVRLFGYKVSDAIQGRTLRQ